MGSVDDNTSGACLAYRASKSALNIISKSLSIDLAGEGVTTVLLHPGWVRGPRLGSTTACARRGGRARLGARPASAPNRITAPAHRPRPRSAADSPFTLSAKGTCAPP
jgi:NAD(P)-dependent dehydrogenase (short-subunit alcohol dehydrogenase family)